MASVSKSTTLDASATDTTAALRSMLKPLASLKITVAVFALALFLILIGSLAQGRRDVILVLAQYFRCWVAIVEIRDFFPPAFFPSLIDYDWSALPVSKFPFPGGWTLGLIATLNLAAAHGLKFKVQVKGARLNLGTGIICAGILACYFVVLRGMNSDGFESEPWLDDNHVWLVFKGLSLATLAGMGYVLWNALPSIKARVATAIFGGALGLGLLLAEQLSAASMRILWQLILAEAASLILLLGCWLLFKKRAGVVLLHAGVAVLMLSEVLVGLNVSETHFRIPEGSTTNVVDDIRERELIVVSHATREAVSIPEAMFLDALPEEGEEHGDVIKDKRLPFDIRVNEFYRNSSLRDPKPDEKTQATAGVGASLIAVQEKESTGMDEQTDVSTLFVELLDKSSGDVLGSHMLSMGLRLPDTVLVDGVLHDVSMRFKRSYKPYTLTLKDIAKRDYVGTATPRDYSSHVTLVDPRHDVRRENIRIYMNNPLRYRGETIYQTGYQRDQRTGEEMTTLQVVNNRSWMLPYLACMIVFTGMGVQFTQALARFLRRERAAKPVVHESIPQKFWAPGIAALVVVSLQYTILKEPAPPKSGEPALYAFSSLPVVKGGRQQPIGSVALDRMRVLTNGKTAFQRELRAKELKEDWDTIREKIVDRIPGLEEKDLKEFDPETGVPGLVTFIANGMEEMEEPEVYARLAEPNMRRRSPIWEKTPAVWWLLDTITDREEAARHRVIRIDRPELLSELDLKPRDGALYSQEEVAEHFDDLKGSIESAVEQARKDDNALDPVQRRLLKLVNAMTRIQELQLVFLEPDIQDSALRPHATLLAAARLQKLTKEQIGARGDTSLVLPIPRADKEEDGKWDSIAMAAVKRGLFQFAKSRGITSVEALADAIVLNLSNESVIDEIHGVTELLVVAKREGQTLADVAKGVRESLGEEEKKDRARLLEILTAIEKARSESAQEIAKHLPETTVKPESLAQVLSEMKALVLPATWEKVQRATQTMQPTPGLLSGIMRDLTREVAASVLTDEELKAGDGEDYQRFSGLLAAWQKGDFDKFNELVDEHKAAMTASDFAEVDVGRTDREARMNHAAPAYWSMWFYIIAFVLALFGLLGFTKPLNRAAFTVATLTFVVHTVTLIERIYISGRPPVTNLYSSAVFIGWGAVLLGLVFEFIGRDGIGNLVSGVCGALSLGIAYLLGAEGSDTFQVLQAVLDTQFWLGTHVVIITLGYSTTFLAGIFGVLYVFMGLFSSSLDEAKRKRLSGMIYGSVCFAMLFSFIGTVLGGLWADDSWGRFWGWDPKENGAMMIVIWNAIVLHARWDKMVRDRGMAVLAIVGNIVTAWSWFGVNELKAGLHAYGFTEGRLKWLIIFMLANLVVICIGLVPKDLWRSYRTKGDLSPESA